MKKSICLIMTAAALITALTSCTKENKKVPNETSAQASSVSAVSTVTEQTSTVTENIQTSASAGENNPSDTTVKKVSDAIIEAYGENYLPTVDIPAENIKTLFGFEDGSYTEIFAQQPMISAHVDMLVIVKAAAGKTDEIKNKLEAYRSSLVNDSMQYPMNIAKVNASKVVSNGDVVAFILLGAIDEREDATEAQQAEFADAQIKIGVDAFNSVK